MSEEAGEGLPPQDLLDEEIAALEAELAGPGVASPGLVRLARVVPELLVMPILVALALLWRTPVPELVSWDVALGAAWLVARPGFVRRILPMETAAKMLLLAILGLVLIWAEAAAAAATAAMGAAMGAAVGPDSLGELAAVMPWWSWALSGLLVLAGAGGLLMRRELSMSIACAREPTLRAVAGAVLVVDVFVLFRVFRATALLAELRGVG